MKIGILQTGRSPEQLVDEFGEYGPLFESMLHGHGFAFQIYDVLESEFPKTAFEADGWLITGSKFAAYEDHDWIAPLENLVREIIAADLPLIGVCFGHQIIAQALGGRVEKFNGGWSVGRVEYRMHDGTTQHLHAWHQDQVVEKPDAACVLGATEFCKYAMLAYGDKVMTVQPHPEFTAGFLRRLAATRGKGVLPDGQLQSAIESLGPAVSNDQVAQDFASIFKRNSPKEQRHG